MTNRGILPNDIDTAPALAIPHKRRTPQERQKDEQAFLRIVDERIKHLSLEHQRAALGQMLTDLLYEDIKYETNRAFGTQTTRDTYTNDFNRFKSWCLDEGLPYLPTSPEIVAHWIMSNTEMQPARLVRTTNAIAYMHMVADKPYRDGDVLVKAALRWKRRHAEVQEQPQANPGPAH
jgi:hypothetical protein